MSETANLIDALKRIQDGDAWHGLSIKEILSDITPEEATAKPISGVHSIAELVLHIAAWEEAFTQRLHGVRMDLPADGDFPFVNQTVDTAWKETQERLESAHEQLLKAVAGLTEADLHRAVTGKDYSIGFMLHGIIRHHVYHAGQIGLLKKAINSALTAIATDDGESSSTSE